MDRMRDTLVHRGPDDAGTFWSEDMRCALAMRRLAILDLSHAGHQPMTDASGQVQVVLNGEIYNHVGLRTKLAQWGYGFRSHSDTEVLLAAYLRWGRECLQHLNGMFAFALYDARERLVLLARDRAGEKPLFYRLADGRLSFASELKALFVDPSTPRMVDPLALEYYLAYGYVPGDLCILEGLNKLRQAEAATFHLDTGDFRRWSYWSLPETEPGSRDDDDDELELEVERLLRDSVRLRLQADVPVGVLLSGGLDSSLVTALAADAAPNGVKTFTITFPGHGTFDEGPYAEIVAKHFGTEHTPLVAEDANLDLLGQMAEQFDEPMADSSMIPTFLVSRLVRGSAAVALGGDGGDELFGGYPHYSLLQRREALACHIPIPVRRLAAVAGARLPLGFHGRNYLLGLAAEGGLAHINLYFDAHTRRLLRPNAPAGQTPEAWKLSLAPHGDVADRAMRTDFRSYLVDDILVKVDRASMANSLELRAPFLDHRLIEMAFGRVPSRLKATTGERKILLRRIGSRLLPPDLDLQRKQGFSLPLDTWLRSTSWRQAVEDVLLDTGSSFDPATTAKLLKSQAAGRPNAQRMFSLWLFETWRHAYGISCPA